MSEATALLFLAVLTSLSVQPESAELSPNLLLPGGLGLGIGGISCGLGLSCGRGRVGDLLRRLVVASGFGGVLIEAGVQIDQIKTSFVRHGIVCRTFGRGDARALGHRRGRIDIGLLLLVVLELA